MQNLSYVNLLEENQKAYCALLDFLQEKHPAVLREWREAAQQSAQRTYSTCGEKLRSGDIWWNECEKCHSKIASG